MFKITKPHNRPITQMLLNHPGTILVTGAEDATIFNFKILQTNADYCKLIPIGYIKVPEIVTCLKWLLRSVSKINLSNLSVTAKHQFQDTTVIVGCNQGHFLQVDLLATPQSYTTITYILHLKPQQNRFVTYKAQIRRDIRLAEIEVRKAEKVAKKRVEMEKILKDNPGLEIDEEVFLADSESEETLEPLHIPEVPNRILWLQPTEEGTIWLSIGGYDAGYLYEYQIDQKDAVPYRFRMIDDADDIEIRNYIYR